MISNNYHKRLYTTEELSAYLRLSKGYILKLRQSGELPHYKISNLNYRYDIAEVKNYFRGDK
jgi:excisionase family DNA binding protein